MAIIGACLPTLAPLWNLRKAPESKKSSYLNSSDLFEDRSVRNLVNHGPATYIHADDIALEDRPQEGIHVNTALSSRYVV